MRHIDSQHERLYLHCRAELQSTNYGSYDKVEELLVKVSHAMTDNSSRWTARVR